MDRLTCYGSGPRNSMHIDLAMILTYPIKCKNERPDSMPSSINQITSSEYPNVFKAITNAILDLRFPTLGYQYERVQFFFRK